MLLIVFFFNAKILLSDFDRVVTFGLQCTKKLTFVIIFYTVKDRFLIFHT